MEVTVARENKIIIDSFPWVVIPEEDAINIVVRNHTDLPVYIIDYNGIESLVTIDTLQEKLTWEGLFVIEEYSLHIYKEYLKSKEHKVNWTFSITNASNVINVEESFNSIKIY